MIIPILLIAIQVVKEDKNKILVRADITESTQYFYFLNFFSEM